MIKRKKKLLKKLNIKKIAETPLIPERGKETPLEDNIFMVEEGLFLSGYSAAKNKEKIFRNKIDFVINLASSHCENIFEGQIQYANYRLKDLPQENIRHRIFLISDKIFEMRAKGRNVLVHCYKVSSQTNLELILTIN